MFYKKHKIYLIYLLFVSLFLGCAVPKISQAPPPIATKTSFNGFADSTNSASIRWNIFFTDKALIALIDSALAHNLDIQMALQRIQMANASLLQSKGARQPFVSSFATPSISKYGDYSMNGAGNNNTPIYNGESIPKNLQDYTLGFQSVWEMDIVHKLTNKKQAATMRLLASVAGKNYLITTLIAAICNAYYELLSYDQTLRILDENIRLQQTALTIVSTQKEAGAATELGVKQFEAQLLNTQGLRIEVVKKIAETENSINTLIGRYPQTIGRDTTFFTMSKLGNIATGIPTNLLENRPDIKQAELEANAAKADVLAARALFYPSLNITTSLGLQAFKPQLVVKPESFFYTFMGNIAAPLLNKSAIKAAFMYANAAQLEALYNYQKTIINGFTETYNEILHINNYQASINIKTKEVNTLTETVNIATDLFRLGRANYLDVLIAQQNTLNAKLALIEHQKNRLIATTNLYKALGGGWR